MKRTSISIFFLIAFAVSATSVFAGSSHSFILGENLTLKGKTLEAGRYHIELRGKNSVHIYGGNRVDLLVPAAVFADRQAKSPSVPGARRVKAIHVDEQGAIKEFRLDGRKVVIPARVPASEAPE